MSLANEQTLAAMIERLLPTLVELRHDLHRHPQIAYHETYASERVEQWLGSLNIAFESGLAETGVVAWIEPTDDAARQRPAVGLRADMDALPITEQTGLAYASQNDGLMHACGHDGHTTILLGVASVLQAWRDHLPQPVKLLFQPAEEGEAGGRRLLEAGALEAAVGGYAIERIFGLHGWPQLPLGVIATRSGPLMASMDGFSVTIHGRGTHGAVPHLGADPIVAAAHIVTALQTIVSRNIDPTQPAVVSVGLVHAGQADNIIPDLARLAGTIRAVDAATAERLHQRIQQIAESTAAALGCEAKVEIRRGYPPLINDAHCAATVLQTARRIAGAKGVAALDVPCMTAEDFAFYAQQRPAAFFLLGLCPSQGGSWPGLHTPRFDFNDGAIAPGVRIMCELALQAGLADDLAAA